MTHGTTNGYHYHKCRCKLCKQAHAAANKKCNQQTQTALRKKGFKLKWVKPLAQHALLVLNGVNPTKGKTYFD